MRCSCAAQEYAEKQGWNMQRSADYRREHERKAKKRLRDLARINKPDHRFLIAWDWDCDLDRPVDRRYVKQVWMPNAMRYVKKMSRRKVRSSLDVANGGAYKKQFDLMYTIW